MIEALLINTTKKIVETVQVSTDSNFENQIEQLLESDQCGFTFIDRWALLAYYRVDGLKNSETTGFWMKHMAYEFFGNVLLIHINDNREKTNMTPEIISWFDEIKFIPEDHTTFYKYCFLHQGVPHYFGLTGIRKNNPDFDFDFEAHYAKFAHEKKKKR